VFEECGDFETEETIQESNLIFENKIRTFEVGLLISTEK